MEDGSDWIIVNENDKIAALRKSNVNAVIPDTFFPDHSYVVAGNVRFRFEGDVTTVLRDILGVDITDGTGKVPLHVTSDGAFFNVCGAIDTARVSLQPVTGKK